MPKGPLTGLLATPLYLRPRAVCCGEGGARPFEVTMKAEQVVLTLTKEEADILHKAIEDAYGEGLLSAWPSESVMRSLGFNEDHWVWEAFDSNRLTRSK